MNYNPTDRTWLKAQLELASPTQGVPLPWWPTMQRYIAGLRPHELTLLCAPTGAGKTQFLANLSAQLVTLGVPHFAAPVETGDTDYAVRVMEALSRTELNTGEPVSPDLLHSINKRYGELLSKSKLFISTYDNRVDTEEMISTLRYMHQQYGCKVALLDNLNFFLQVTSARDQMVEMDRTIHEFVMAAKEIPMHTILIMHPRKTDGGRVESEFDIKGSSTAVQEATNILLFNRPSKEQIEKGKSLRDRELVFRKIRKRGKFVGLPVWLTYDSGRYREIT